MFRTLLLSCVLAVAAPASAFTAYWRDCKAVQTGWDQYNQPTSREVCTDRYETTPDAPGGPARGPAYGAIATAAPTTDHFGYSYGQGTRAAAERVALSECARRAGSQRHACRVTTWFYNQCGAIARGADNAWGADHAGSLRVARTKALAACQANDRSGGCKVSASYCSY